MQTVQLTAELIAESEGGYAVYEAETGTTVATLKTDALDPDPDFIPSRIAFSPDSSLFALAGQSFESDGTLQLWTLPDGRPFAVWTQADWSVLEDLAFSPDGQRILTAGVEHVGAISTVDVGDARITAVPVNDPSAPSVATPPVLATTPGMKDAVGAHVRTGRARHKIRQVLKREAQSSAEKLGQEMLEREMKRRRLGKIDDEEMDRAARALSLTDATHLLASIGQGDVNVTLALKHLFPDSSETEAPKPNVFERFVDRVRGTKGVRIQGVDGLMVRYAQCCQPVPGDPVVGYVTRGRGVSIHRGDCPNLLLLAHEPERRLEIDWQEAQGERFVVRLALEGNDRRGLYADVAAAVSSTGTDIKSMDLRSTDGRTIGSLLVEVENLAHLEKIIRATRRVKGITDVARRERLTTE